MRARPGKDNQGRTPTRPSLNPRRRLESPKVQPHQGRVSSSREAAVLDAGCGLSDRQDKGRVQSGTLGSKGAFVENREEAWLEDPGIDDDQPDCLNSVLRADAVRGGGTRVDSGLAPAVAGRLEGGLEGPVAPARLRRTGSRQRSSRRPSGPP